MRKLTAQEISTILAALRLAQQNRDELDSMDHFADVDPLDDDEIDELCETLNTSDTIIDTTSSDRKLLLAAVEDFVPETGFTLAQRNRIRNDLETMPDGDA